MNTANELREIKDQIEDLMAQAEMLIDDFVADNQEKGARIISQRAEGYWMAHVDKALNQEDWFSMEATINEIEEMEAVDADE